MKIAIIGRTEILLETAELLLKQGYSIPLVITAKEAPEYKKTCRISVRSLGTLERHLSRRPEYLMLSIVYLNFHQ